MKVNNENSTHDILEALEKEWESVHGCIDEHIKDATTMLEEENKEGKE